jgi:hypothetical protein
MKRRHINLFAFGLLLAAGWSELAVAQPLDEASRATARTLGHEGIEAYRNKNYPLASEKLERAFRVVKVPSVALWSARAFEKNGKLVEAAERYLEATRLPVTSGDRATQEQARTDAATEREALMPRIPTLKVEVGAGVDQVRIDDVVVPLDLLGVPRPVNPGSHTVKASRGATHKSESVSLKESDQQSLKFDVPAGPGDSDQSGSGVAADRSGKSHGKAGDAAHEPGQTQRIAGWTTLAVGGAGIAVGSIAGILVMAKHNSSDVKTQCDGSRCPTSLDSTVSSFNTLRNVSTIGFIVGAVGIGTGIGLLLTSPKSQRQTGRVTTWIGVGSVGVSGGF